VNSSERKNYIFNSNIEGLEESDLIILVGTNPRFEATILNSRIRRAYLKNKTTIYSVGDVGDLTYPYAILDNNTKIIKDIVSNKHEVSTKIINAKKPIIVIGQSVLKIKSGIYIFEELKKYLLENNKINNEWNSLNILSTNASTVGAYDLGILSSNNGKNTNLDKIKKNELEILFLFGQDDLKFIKSKEFIIYIGSHGDRGAEIADIILPGSAYTEQDGYFTNLEGKIQKAYKATYPPGEAKEDWQIINELSALISKKYLYYNKDDLIKAMLNYLKLHTKIGSFQIPNYNFLEENILVDEINYYHSNSIARASKTMTDCKNARVNFKKTGTET
jgi:NADH-quinone oxidoreductase subunit G